MAREIAAMIRDFQRADLAALKALVHKTIATCYPSRYCAEAVRFFIDYHDEEAILRDAKEGRTLVLDKASRILGTGTIVGGEIKRVFVDPTFQKQGFGRRIMQRLEEAAARQGVKTVKLDAARDGGYDVRIFTPGAEVPFAGHPTLGTAYVIRQEIIGASVPRVTLNLKVGQIPVAFEQQADSSDLVWMTPKEAVFGETFEPGEIAPLLTLGADDIDPDFPIQAVSTGLPFVLLPLRSLEAVRRARVVRDKWLDWVKDRPAKMAFVFCRETVHPANQIHARAFCDYYGIVEDPATGSANSCFAAYLAQHRYFGSDEINVRVEQGYEIGRPSLIYLKAQNRGGTIHAEVGGQVMMIAQGKLL